MRIALLLLTLLLAGCASAPQPISIAPVCPQVKEYSRAQESEMGKQFDAIPAAHTELKQFIRDAIALRRAAKACR